MMDFTYQLLQPFSLVLSRLSPLFLALGMSPVSRFPLLVRLVLLVVSAVALSSLAVHSWQPIPKANWLFALAGEFALGALMALGFQLTFAAIQVMGRVLDMQIGFAAAGVVDPVTSNNDPLIGTMLTLFVTLAIFVTNTHQHILAILLENLALIPPGSWDGAFSVSSLLAYFSTQMVLASLLFGPVIMGLWLLDLFNGFIAKTMPQMNVYFVMLPLKIGVGIFLLSVAMRYLKPIVRNIFETLLGWFQLGWVN